MSPSDRMLEGGAVAHVAALHGESVNVISGLDAGLTFSAVRETESVATFNGDLGEDIRARRMVRFRVGHAPRLTSQDILETADGLRWRTVRRPEDNYLTVDYELVAIGANDTA